MRRLSARIPAVAVAGARSVSSDHKAIVSSYAAPKPPMATYEPATAADFTPHIEWYEFPLEFWSGYYPFSRNDRIANYSVIYEMSDEELAQRYGLRILLPGKMAALGGFLLQCLYPCAVLWGCYRAWGNENSYHDFVAIMEAEGVVIKIEDDDLFLDSWQGFHFRVQNMNNDPQGMWRPPIKQGGAQTSWKLPFEPKDLSEIKHHLSKN
jgi:hypothetical protein